MIATGRSSASTKTTSRALCLLFVGTAACGSLDEPSDSDTGEYLALSLKPAANCLRNQPLGTAFADGVCQHTLSLTFPQGSSPGVDVTFGTSLGTFSAPSGLSPDRATLTAKTAQLSEGGASSFGALIAPLVPGTADVSVTVGSSRVTQSVVFERAAPTLVELGATVRTFDRAGRSSDMVVQLRREPDEGSPSVGTRIAVHSCCPALPGATSQSCAAYLSAPTLLESNSSAPTTLTFTARATSDGEAYLGQSVTAPDWISVYVVAQLERDAFECPQPEGDAGNSSAPAGLEPNAVELRWVRRP